MEPISVPISVPISTTPKPARTETVVPAMVSDSTSCPSSLVPNGYCTEGGMKRAAVSMPPATCSGCGASAGPKAAKNRMIRDIAAPTMDSRLWRNRNQARASPRGPGGVVSPEASGDETVMSSGPSG